ncbi:HipA domain-containing protein [Marinobacterium ramblicola]|uniref:HipA domain-containing protein n=1 Tax=Marinobacterium ramblicola TaxID=2849041 RepID=UPI002484D22D|nr:HipA domain-containing protein [Marinobacterium ramblicola]
MLISPGSSLGGARPKASVMDEAGNLLIAKFPSRYDDHDIGAWEYLTYRLALDAGIDMAECRIERFNSFHHTFLTKRFDRNGDRRIHFSSAMTLLEYYDGEEGVGAGPKCTPCWPDVHTETGKVCTPCCSKCKNLFPIT